ncbi:chitobiase/beta-hexosaminidase C-terminal domain-containing protein [Haloferula chungangensis]|uniref:Chitobiase/beta-hexosaminidase C-terminal domain-containing protein n=1 Tax=Haloferula chungangensis TaxID=1048331 RepID=A0ABW2L0L2_9BACT
MKSASGLVWPIVGYLFLSWPLVSAVDQPAFSPGSLESAVGFEVTVTCGTPGADIFYTTNGIDPSTADAAVISGSTIFIAKSQTLKAKAWLGGASSNVTSADYTLTGCISAGRRVE